MHDCLRGLIVSQRPYYALSNFLRNIIVTQSLRILYRTLLPNFVQHEYQLKEGLYCPEPIPAVYRRQIYRAMER